MLNFFAISFLVAGAIAAAAPTLIHLLNRQRYRTVEWGAMDFLQAAIKRSRKVIQLRDLILLALRTLCVLLFGLAMARPYFQSGGAAGNPDAAVHAIVLVDNSLSMGYASLQGDLLSEAKAKATEFIEDLPRGSYVSVLPLCGPASDFSIEPYRTPEDAIEALETIRVVDRQGSAATAASLAVEASALAPELPTKRIVLIGDQQPVDWPIGSADALKELPELQVAQVKAADAENAWVEDLHLRDGLADVETPAVLLATVRYEGPEPRRGVQVTLNVDDVAVASRTVDLQPGQAREIDFDYKFDVVPDPGRPAFSKVHVTIPPDRLATDDQRFLVAPVLASVPVVFVDQYGAADEDPINNRFGETLQLRRLLAPSTSRVDSARQLIEIRHTTMERLIRQSTPSGIAADDDDDEPGFGLLPRDDVPLDSARLVVVAGVTRPDAESVQLLREYVLQGGQLLIAAGGKFDPAAWQEVAWQDGAGILPLPLSGDTVGQVPLEAPDELRPFFFDFDSLAQHHYFKLETEGERALADLYGEPLIFKAIVADDRDETLDALVKMDEERITSQREFVEQESQRALKESQGQLNPEEAALRPGDAQKLEAIRPQWLLWNEVSYDDQVPAPALARQYEPRVLARFTNGKPALIERQLGAGRIVMFTTGVFAGTNGDGWNTIPRSDAVVLFDRVLRSMIESTLPERNWGTVDEIQLPIAPAFRRAHFSVTRPDGIEEPLSVDALGGDRYGVTIRHATQRGHYVVTARRPESAAYEGLETQLFQIPLAVNGPGEESDIRLLDEDQFYHRLGEDPLDTTSETSPDDQLATAPQRHIRWVSAGDPLSIEGATTIGQNFWWKLLMLAVLALLLCEMLLIVWPQLGRKEAA